MSRYFKYYCNLIFQRFYKSENFSGALPPSPMFVVIFNYLFGFIKTWRIFLRVKFFLKVCSIHKYSKHSLRYLKKFSNFASPPEELPPSTFYCRCAFLKKIMATTQHYVFVDQPQISSLSLPNSKSCIAL